MDRAAGGPLHASLLEERTGEPPVATASHTRGSSGQTMAMIIWGLLASRSLEAAGSVSGFGAGTWVEHTRRSSGVD